MSSVSATSSTIMNTSCGPHTGRVKWFNKKAGYGFIKPSDGESDDLFVYYTSIQSDVYRYLLDGEYVSYDISQCDEGSKHKVQATNVRGLNGDKLLCEIQNEQRSNRSNNQQTSRRSTRTRKDKDGNVVMMRRVVKYVPVKNHQQ